MSNDNNLQLPASTCAYEHYDPATLAPLNKETFIRLQELGWSKDDFDGRRVLDIGCNSGLLTMHALKLGASHVHACDVQPTLIEFVERVVAARQLPVTVENIPFHKLDPATHQTDIVLFMEVLHWAVSQGLELRNVIERLAALTQGILYLEFPWSVKEPSIQKQTKLTEQSYSADAVLDELTRYFMHVRVVRFMSYFGFGSGSQRVLVEARGKRPEASILAQLPRVYSLDLPLSRGRNESYLLTSPQGPMVAKLIAPESSLGGLREEIRNQTFDELTDNRPPTLVLPIKQGGRYFLPAPGNRFWMLFPFIGPLPSTGKSKTCPSDTEFLIDLFINVRRDFRPLSAELLKSLRDGGLIRNFRSIAAADAGWANNAGALIEMKERLVPILQDVLAADKEALDALCHGDLQTGNFLLDEDGVPRVVDLDAISIGTVYSDGLTGLIWRGFEAKTLATFCDKLGAEETRPVSKHDVSYAIAYCISWFSTVQSLKAEETLREQIVRFRKGLEEAILFCAQIT